MNEPIERALESLRPAMGADGFELRLGSIDPDGSVRIVLEAGPNACMDCLVPDDVLVGILERTIRAEAPAVGRVVLEKRNIDPH